MKAKIKSGQYTFPSPEWDCVSEAGEGLPSFFPFLLFFFFVISMFAIFICINPRPFSERSYQKIVEDRRG